MSEAALVLRQVRYTNKAFWRNPASAFFTFAFPLMFLVIFTSLLERREITIRESGRSTSSTYYVMAEAAFGVISRVLHEHRHQRQLPARPGDPETDAWDAAAGVGLPAPPGSSTR